SFPTRRSSDLSKLKWCDESIRRLRARLEEEECHGRAISRPAVVADRRGSSVSGAVLDSVDRAQGRYAAHSHWLGLRRVHVVCSGDRVCHERHGLCQPSRCAPNPSATLGGGIGQVPSQPAPVLSFPRLSGWSDAGCGLAGHLVQRTKRTLEALRTPFNVALNVLVAFSGLGVLLLGL